MACFGLSGRDGADRAEQAVGLVRIDSFEGGVFDGLDRSPRAARVDRIGLVEAVDRFGRRVVVAVADAADRRIDPGFGQAPGVFDRQALDAAIAVMLEARSPGGLRRAAVAALRLLKIETVSAWPRPPRCPGRGAGLQVVAPVGGACYSIRNPTDCAITGALR